MSPRWRQSVCALGAFVLLAVIQTWPLVRHLPTHLTGPVSGDTGVYVWNTWVFRHELVEAGRSPLRTSSIFSLSAEADLSLHNYTLFADVMATPLQPVLGVVATFNVVYLANLALAGFGMFILARQVTGRTLEAWIAGAMFACAPFLVARSTAHFSLVAAAPLPFFLYWLDRAWRTQRLRDAAAVGVCVAWAAFCDVYYAVYCVMLGTCFVASQVFAWSTGRRREPPRGARVIVDAAIVALALLIAGVHVIGGGSIRIASISISMRSLYTPVLVLSLLVLVRLMLTVRPKLAWRPPLGSRAMWRAGVAAVLVAAVLLAPTISAVGKRAAEGRLVGAPVMWRSSPPGADLLAFVAPNPTHPLTPQAIANWTTRAPGGFVEQVVAVSLVGLAVIVIAWRRAGYRPRRLWLGVTVGFGLLALGPFVHVAGFNTYLPTPWTLLRYVPLIGEARMPTRFAIVAMLGFCLLFACALVALTSRDARRRKTILAVVGAGLALELLPIPRTLYSASVPRIYDIIAADPRPVRVLELPYGVRDGLSSLGDFSAASQFHQTYHGKSIAGGYLSRVSAQRKASYRKLAVRSALMTLSERRPLLPDQERRARAAAENFLRSRNIGYVVVDTGRTSAELRTFAIQVLGLTRIAESDGFELFVPQGRNPP